MLPDTSNLAKRFGMILMLALTGSVLTFAAVRIVGGALLEYRIKNTDYQSRKNEARITAFQSYINRKHLSATDTVEIKAWEQTQPLLFMEIYRANGLLYTSSMPEDWSEIETEASLHSWESYYELAFADGNAEVFIIANDIYRVYSVLTILSFVLSAVVFLYGYVCGTRRLIRYMKTTIREQNERETRLFHVNRAVITQMSHDLRTPMTIIQIYLDILKYKKCTPEQVPDYLNRIDGKVSQMKQLCDNMFEYALISKEEPVKPDPPCNFHDIIHDPVSEAVAYLGDQGFCFSLNLSWPPVRIRVYPPTSFFELCQHISPDI